MRYRDVNPVYSAVLYAIGKAVQSFFFNTLWRRQVSGQEHIPPMGTAVIFASNHRSLSDPSNVGSTVPYPIFYFAKEELFRVPILGWYIRRVNSFPVRRQENDVTALKTAVNVLKHGGALLLFPEGGRRLTPEKQFKAKAGVGMLACKTGTPVVPVGIRNGERFTKLGQLIVKFGKPMQPPAHADRAAYQTFSDEVMLRIKELSQ